ncbi:hypothetical protein [Marinicrinis sediminis]|uniref:SGNH/GDSL hydrolase family protein n=1 Tax=Marinicrinis sediminis TaxID=1652465 RepID=A0ABW5RBC5_9BACL
MNSFTSNSSKSHDEENRHTYHEDGPDDGVVRQTVASSQGRALRRWRLRSLLGIVGVLVLLVLLELTLFRNLAFYGKSPGFIGQLAELEASFEATHAPNIEVAIFGDSLGLDALRPDLLADAAGMNEEEIFNFSISGGSAYDMAKLYHHYEASMPGLKKVLIVVNEHQFNNLEAASDIKFKFFAGLQDRLDVMNTQNYGDLLLGWMLKSYDMRSIWKKMLEKYESGDLREAAPVYEGGLPPVTWSPKEYREPAYAKKVAQRWFENYEIEGIRTDKFGEMLAAMSERDLEVVVIRLPRSEAFETYTAVHYADEQQAFQSHVAETAKLTGAVSVVLPQELLTYPNHFRDVNHVNPEGAKVVSSYVAERWLEEQ